MTPTWNHVGNLLSYFSPLYHFFLFYSTLFYSINFPPFVLTIMQVKERLSLPSAVWTNRASACRAAHQLWMSMSLANWSNWLILYYVALLVFLFSFVRLWSLFILKVNRALLHCRELADTLQAIYWSYVFSHREIQIDTDQSNNTRVSCSNIN